MFFNLILRVSLRLAAPFVLRYAGRRLAPFLAQRLARVVGPRLARPAASALSRPAQAMAGKLMKRYLLKRFLVLALLGSPVVVALPAQAQVADSSTLAYKGTLLLTDPRIQLQSTRGLNALYDYDFFKAEAEFKWFRREHPEHPMPYFLMGLSYWWQMMPEPDITKFDDRFLAYMDTCIDKAEALAKREKNNPEALFFLAAGHGFQGRFHAERKNWVRAANAGRAAMSNMQRGSKSSAYSIEFLFGEALYNYYREYIPEAMKIMKPMMSVFPKGDKVKGLKQLEEVARNSFYTRPEAMYFLMRIYGNEEGNPNKAWPVAQLLSITYPNNPYFMRAKARYAYSTGHKEDCIASSQQILDGIAEKRPGFGPVGGRYASFYLGHYAYANNDYPEAKKYLQMAKIFGEDIDAEESGYYLYAVAYLARIADKEGDKDAARSYYKTIDEYTGRKNPLQKEARAWLKANKEPNKGWWIF